MYECAFCLILRHSVYYSYDDCYHMISPVRDGIFYIPHKFYENMINSSLPAQGQLRFKFEW